MMISEIKKWAKTQGYEVIKDKEDGLYYWAKLDAGPDASGVAKSVSKVATAIFNHLTNNQWVQHQIEFQNKEDEIKFITGNYGS